MLKGVTDYIRKTDRFYLLLCALCSSLSVVALISIGNSMLRGNYRRALVQGGAALVGLVFAVLISTRDYHIYAQGWPVHAAVTWGLVLLTFAIGHAPAGTTNKAWIELPMGLSLQPTELAKISFIFTFALHLSQLGEDVNDPRQLVKVLAHLLTPAVLIHLQGDDGTMIVFLLIGVTMLFAAGLSYRYIFAAGGAGILAAPLIWVFFLERYQKNRIIALFHPDEYTTLLWQQTRGRIAIGSGQILGKGFFTTDRPNVPLAYNDFIFAYIAESVGFVGSILVLLLLLGLAARTLQTARRSEDSLGYLICVGIFGIFFWQTVINLGMCLLLLPVIGITLPLMSAGGTSVMTIYLAVGVVLSVYIHNKKTLFDHS